MTTCVSSSSSRSKLRPESTSRPHFHAECIDSAQVFSRVHCDEALIPPSLLLWKFGKFGKFVRTAHDRVVRTLPSARGVPRDNTGVSLY
jgi:hypothetical protein